MHDLKKTVETWKADPDTGVRVVALGASNTEVLWHSLGRHGWATWLACSLRAHVGRHVSMTNCGISGNTSAEALARLERDVLPLDPTCVVITLGGNDLMRATREALIANLRQIHARLRDAGATPVFQTYYAFDYQTLEEAQQQFPEFMAAVVRLADELGEASIDQHSWFHPWYLQDREAYMRIMLDSHHLRPVGNAIMGTLCARSFGLPDPTMPPDIHDEVKQGLEAIARHGSPPAAVRAGDAQNSGQN